MKSSLDDRFIGCWTANNPQNLFDLAQLIQPTSGTKISLYECVAECMKLKLKYAGIMVSNTIAFSSYCMWNRGYTEISFHLDNDHFNHF